MFELLPVSAAFQVKDDVRIDIVADSPLPPSATLRLTHLGLVIAEAEPPLGESVSFGTLEEGGYGVLLCDGDEVLASTALQVLDDTRQRLRYGFVASYAPDKDVEAVARLARKLHLNGIQFYDWAYRHADLVGGGETYLDPLDQPISLETVRRLIRALAQAGSRSFGYAAVYGVGVPIADTVPPETPLILTGNYDGGIPTFAGECHERQRANAHPTRRPVHRHDA